MTTYAVPFWIFITLFLVLPVGLLIWMSIKRHRVKAKAVQGFEVKLTEKSSVTDQKKENDHG